MPPERPAVNNPHRAALRELGLPTGRDEHWKYAPGRLLARRDWWVEPAEALSLPEPAVLARVTLPLDAPVLAFAGGHAVPRSSGGFGALPPGVTLRPLPQAPSVDGDATDSPVRCSAIAAATTPGAWELSVAPNTEAGDLQLLHLPAAGAGALVLRVVVGRGSSLRLLESVAGDGPDANGDAAASAPASAAAGAPQVVRWLQVQVREGARLIHATVQHLPTTAALLEQLDVTVARDGHYEVLPAVLGGQAVQSTARVELAGSGATAHWAQLLRVGGTTHADVHLTLRHGAANTTSTQQLRALADGRSRGAFCGKVVMPSTAHGADSAQSIRNLLLSPQAELDTRPQLEIHVHDVKASHGTTTGSLDPQALFYLRSRGIGELESRRLLTQAFAHEVISRLPWAEVREWLAARVMP